MKFHEDIVARESAIAAYLLNRLDAEATEAFESHYLACDRCFEELGAAELLSRALGERKLGRRHIGDVLVLRFESSAELVMGSRELTELARCLPDPNDSKVVLDLSRVSRIDSSGLGELMRLYTHLVRAEGALKVVNPSPPLARVLRMTRIDSVLETHDDETAALRSFGQR